MQKCASRRPLHKIDVFLELKESCDCVVKHLGTCDQSKSYPSRIYSDLSLNNETKLTA